MLTPSARAALHVPGDGIVDPLRLTIGYAELAARNGVDGAPRRAGHRLPHARRAHHPCRDAGRGDRRRVRRERRRHRGRHGVAARRRRAVHDVAAAGAVLAARPRGRLEVPGDRRRRPDDREPRRLLRPDHARIAAARPDGARRDGPARPGHGRGDARRACSKPPAGSCRSSTGGGRSRRLPPTGRRPSPATGSGSTETAPTSCTPPASARPGSRPRRQSPSWCTRSSPRPARRCRTSARGRRPLWKRSRGSSGTAIRRRSSRATRPTATSCARASR